MNAGRGCARALMVCTALAAMSGGGCAALLAATVAPPSQDPASVTSGTYAVETAHTQIAFDVLHLGFSHFNGMFSGVTGTLVIDAADPARDRLRLIVPVASLYTTSPQLTAILQGASWLDAARFPTMNFVSTEVRAEGPGAASVTGDLTLHGVTRRVTAQVRFIGGGTNPLTRKFNFGVRAIFGVARSAFGVDRMTALVSDQTAITIDAAFTAP